MKAQVRAALLGALLLTVLTVGAQGAPQGVSYRPSQFGAGVFDSVVTILLTADGQTQAVGSGLVVRGDGLILTAYHLVKGAPGVAVRLRNGETFDRAELVATDERRNVALLRIAAAGLYPATSGALEEGLVGGRVWLIWSGAGDSTTGGVLSAVSLADEIQGAGTGYRVLRFNASVAPTATGGVVVDERGRPLGILTAQPQAREQNYAVPLSSVVGLVRGVGVQIAPPVALVRGANAPVPVPQSEVSVPQRPTLPLEARGPGSVVVKPSRPVDVLLGSKTIYVSSSTAFFKPAHLINELKKRAELDAWGLSFVDDVRVADLILNLDHVVFTWKYTFTLTHQRTGVVVATGSRIIWDGNLGAPYMAERVVEKLTQVRAQTPTATRPDAKEKTPK
jgi:S1-C subfamily serine protease